MTTINTEIRKLQPIELCTLAQILNQSNSWKKLMAIIPNDTNGNECLFNNEHFVMIEQASHVQQRSCADIFLSDWSTLGKKRPTCRSMLDLLIKAELFRAADYLAVDILKGEPPKRPKTGPAAPVDTSDEMLEELLRQQNLKNKCNRPKDTKQSWSLHYTEKPVHLDNDHIEETKRNSIESDLMKFSVSNEQIIRDGSPQMSDLMKFSSIKDNDYLVENYGLQEARSEDIPLCVRENAFQSSKITTSVTDNSDSSTSIESSDQKDLTNEPLNLPNVSQNIIPLVVLQYNENKRNT